MANPLLWLVGSVAALVDGITYLAGSTVRRSHRLAALDSRVGLATLVALGAVARMERDFA